jgi:hypothetical protein
MYIKLRLDTMLDAFNNFFALSKLLGFYQPKILWVYVILNVLVSFWADTSESFERLQSSSEHITAW